MSGDADRVRLLLHAKQCLGAELTMPEPEAHLWLTRAAMRHRMPVQEVCRLVITLTPTGGLADLKELLDAPPPRERAMAATPRRANYRKRGYRQGRGGAR